MDGPESLSSHAVIVPRPPAVTVAPAADVANDKTGHTVTAGLGGEVVVVAADNSFAGLKSKLPARKTFKHRLSVRWMAQTSFRVREAKILAVIIKVQSESCRRVILG